MFCLISSVDWPQRVAALAAAGVVMLAKENAMTKPPAGTDPNAELHAFEPLRVALALGALLLGLVLSIH